MKNPDAKDCVLGVDIGGTKMAAAAVDRPGIILSKAEVPSPSHDGRLMIQALLGEIRDARRVCEREGFEVRAVGVGAAGFVLQPEGVVIESPNIAWSMVPLRETLGRELGIPVAVDNDANAAALGERFGGVARGVDDFVYVTLGTGIGGAVCIGGEIYRGHRGTAGEIGHMVVDPGGPECKCGRRGCLESLASGTALAREAAGLLERTPDSPLFRLCGGDAGRITGETVSRAAEAGDPAAIEAFRRVAFYLGLGLVSLLHIFDPEMVVLGGGVSASGRFLIDEVERVIANRGLSALTGETRVVLSSLGTDAGPLGAAVMAWECAR